MKKTKTTDQGEKNIVAVEEALGRSEQFIEKNQNILIGVILAIALIIGGYIAYTRFILEPREQQAIAEIFPAEQLFEQDSLRLALEGNGNDVLGFLDIISNYRMTKTANLARYYAGISYLNLGEYENAIEHLKKFRKRDQILGAMAYGAIGDAYMQLENMNNAARYYKKAANHKPNQLTSPAFLIKLGLTYELMGQFNDALESYTTIQKDFPETNEGRNIERYIARARMARK
jgi:tetratricopeptide (TPR) repeat protein